MNDYLGNIVGLIVIIPIVLFVWKFLISWYHEIPKRNRLLEEILAELKKQNGSDK